MLFFQSQGKVAQQIHQGIQLLLIACSSKRFKNHHLRLVHCIYLHVTLLDFAIPLAKIQTFRVTSKLSLYFFRFTPSRNQGYDHWENNDRRSLK